MPLESVVDVPGLCPPPEPYSYAVRAGDTLYLAGQVALDEAGEVVGTTVAEQALSGLPALSVPAGFDRDGLPIGLQIAAVPFDEETALRIGASFESAVAVSQRRPPTHAAGVAAGN